MAVRLVYKCDKCGTEATFDSLHDRPRGWAYVRDSEHNELRCSDCMGKARGDAWLETYANFKQYCEDKGIDPNAA